MYQRLRISSLAIVLLLFIQNPYAQAQVAQNAQTSGQSYVNIRTGSFLPYDIDGVRDLLPIWGVRFGHGLTPSLALEYSIDMARAKGVVYNLGSISLRHDFDIKDVLPLFVLFGFDAHYYKRADSVGEISGDLTSYPFVLTTGWHAGFGTETLIYGSIYFRSDVRFGFSPGRQLNVSLGLTYRF